MICFRYAITSNINLNLVRNTTIICIKHFIQSIFEMKQFPADLRSCSVRGKVCKYFVESCIWKHKLIHWN